MGLVAPSLVMGGVAWPLLLGAQPTSCGRPFTPDRPPAMEFHLLNVEAAAGSPIAWLSLFLCCVGASRARGSWSAQAGEKRPGFRVQGHLAKRETPAAQRMPPPPRPPIQAELPASLSSKPFQRKKDESLGSPDPASPISWLALGLPGSGRSTDPLSKLCSRSPQPRHRRASLGLGLRDKRVSKFPFGDFAISGSKTVKEDHNKIVKNNLMRKCTGILLATPGRPFPAPAPSPTPAAATALW